jgi:hypothetical protein
VSVVANRIRRVDRKGDSTFDISLIFAANNDSTPAGSSKKQPRLSSNSPLLNDS